MGLIQAITSRNELLNTVGKAVLNIQYPKEFELYVIAFELTDEDLNPLQYFVFPVNPSSLEESKSYLTNTKKTLAGVTTLTSQTFNPIDITLSGSFGRNFKVLLGETYEDLVSSFKYTRNSVTKESVQDGIKQFFDERVKTGYGCLKILEEMIDKSNSTDGGIKKLIFHNPAFGNSYLVKASNFRISMSENENMIHKYSVQLKTIASLESLKSKDELKKAAKQLVVTGYAQKRVNNFLNGASNLLGKGFDRLAG